MVCFLNQRFLYADYCPWTECIETKGDGSGGVQSDFSLRFQMRNSHSLGHGFIINQGSVQYLWSKPCAETSQILPLGVELCPSPLALSEVVIEILPQYLRMWPYLAAESQ